MRMAETTVVIPDDLARRAIELDGPAGLAWVDRLPALVAECARRWGLAVELPFPNLSYNYAAPATRADGTRAVLKVCLPNSEFLTEAEALRLFDGRGLREAEAQLRGRNRADARGARREGRGTLRRVPGRAPRLGRVLERRVYFLAEELGLDRERVRN